MKIPISEGIEIKGAEYIISSPGSITEGFFGGSLADSNLRKRDIAVENNKEETLALIGTEKELETLGKGDSLIVPDKSE